MRFDTSKLNNVEVLDRICSLYGFNQKVLLANHFNIAASSLSNRYTREAISYDFAAICAVETGANLQWILTGKGERFDGEGVQQDQNAEFISLEKFTISEGKLHKNGVFCADRSMLETDSQNAFCLFADGNLHIIEKTPAISEGLRLVDIDGMISIREITALPAKRLHVSGGKVPFECSIDDINLLGRVIGIYREVN